MLAGRGLAAYWRFMRPEPEDRDFVLADFHERYWSDLAAGRRPELQRYLDAFPGHEELIEDEFAELEGEESTTGTSLDPAPEEAGDRHIGHYRLLEILGRGGQAVVWLAEDLRVHRRVALKVFSGDQVATPELIGRFRREAALAAKAEHPAICPLLDFGLDGRPWIAFRYIPGLTLAHILLEQRAVDRAGGTGPITLPSATDASTTTPTSGPPLGREEIIRLIEKVARGIHAAHEVGIVHRDLKPSNIMVQPDGEPVVLDFGIARADGFDLPTLTQTGDVLGTPAYLAPEQIEPRGKTVDRRIDVYALGVILFECLTGRRPFEVPHREGLYRAILEEEAPRLRSIDSRIGSDLEVVVETALQKTADQRYSDALALAEDLRRILEHRPILARPIGPLTRALRWTRRNLAQTISATTVLVVLAAALVTTLSFLKETRIALEGEREALAEIKRQKESVFRLRSAEVLDLLLVEQGAELWPVVPDTREQATAMLRQTDDWLGRADRLIRNLDEPDPLTGAPSLREQLAMLEARALPRSPEEIDRDRRLHPRWERLVELQTARAELLASDPIDQVGLAELDLRIEEANRVVDKSRSWTFADPDESWWHSQLSRFVDLLDRIVNRRGTLTEDTEDEGWSVRRRREFLATVVERSLDDEAEAWAEAAGRVARHPAFAGFTLLPRIGLVPLGPDPVSGLEEFWDLASGERPERDPDTQRLVMRPATGIVFVLVPEGKVLRSMVPNGGPAQAGEETREVYVAPGFMSKYELTRAQFERLFCYQPRDFSRSLILPTGEPRNGPLNPVTGVENRDARKLLSRFGMAVPRGEFWEWAARGGSKGRWETGDDPAALLGHARLLGWEANGRPREPDWTDHDDVCDVGMFAPNAYGLYDVHGNVAEWAIDYVRSPDNYRLRYALGGSYRDGPEGAAFDHWFITKIETRTPFIGIRPSRPCLQ